MENLRSNNKKILTDNKQDLNLQILDWFADEFNGRSQKVLRQ